MYESQIRLMHLKTEIRRQKLPTQYSFVKNIFNRLKIFFTKKCVSSFQTNCLIFFYITKNKILDKQSKCIINTKNK